MPRRATGHRVRFKGNLAIFFFVMGLAVVASHAVSGQPDGRCLAHCSCWGYLVSMLGQITGVYMGKRVSPARFNQLVLVLLIVLGIQLLI